MYKIIKAEGNASDIYLINTNTDAHLNLGKPTKLLNPLSAVWQGQ